MQHLIYSSTAQTFKIAILIKEDHFDGAQLHKFYVEPLIQKGIPKEEIILFALPGYTKRIPAAVAKQNLTDCLDTLEKSGVEHLIVADGSYYKYIVKVTKTTNMHGEVKQGVFPGYEQFKVYMSINYMAIKHNADMSEQLSQSLSSFARHYLFEDSLFNKPVIESMSVPQTLRDIHVALTYLWEHPHLACDIETYGLRFNEAGIGTIAFAWDKHNGIAIDVTHSRSRNEMLAIYDMLQWFFENYCADGGILYFHNALFDCKILIYEVFMRGVYDMDLMHKGLDAFANVECTQIMAFLSKNSTSMVKLDLKSNAYEFAGNYAQEDIKDITKIPTSELLEYNLTDCCCTLYVLEKFKPIMVADKQQVLYNNLFQPSIGILLKMMLVGLPVDPKQVDTVQAQLEEALKNYLEIIQRSPLYAMLNFDLRLIEQRKKNNKLKKKFKSLRDFSHVRFNPGSDPQKQYFLYEMLGLEPIDTTDTGAPAVGKKTLTKLLTRLKTQFDFTDEDIDG